jgi:type IV pilus assembly protein PilE
MRNRGFTLIELMVVVLVITILTVIAVPSYTSSVRKAHRTEAKSILSDLAAREERYMATNGSYTADITQLGLSVAWGSPVGSGYYALNDPTASLVAATAGTVTTAGTPAQFKLTATAYGAQQKDTQCYNLSIDQSGAQTSSDASSTATTGCWQ